MMITGGGNFPTKKKEKQNIARDKNMEEWREIQGLLDKIQSTGRGGISSDDPEVVQKLEAKVMKLEAWQETMKATNAYYCKHKTLDDCPHLLKSEVEKLKVNMASNWRSEPKPFETYQLTNNNAEIRRLKKRIQTLITSKEKVYGGWAFEGGKVEVNKEENRLRIFFDERPNEQIRSELKSHGFRWSPKANAWQQQLTDNAVRVANSMACLQPNDEKQLQNKEQEATPVSNWLLVEYGALSNAKLRIIPEDDLQNEVAALTIGRIEHEQFLAFSQVNEEFVQLFNDTFQEQFTLVHEQTAKTPQILIQWSESALQSSEVMPFAEGNPRMMQLEEEIFHDTEKLYGYCKTRYHVRRLRLLVVPSTLGNVSIPLPHYDRTFRVHFFHFIGINNFILFFYLLLNNREKRNYKKGHLGEVTLRKEFGGVKPA